MADLMAPARLTDAQSNTLTALWSFAVGGAIAAMYRARRESGAKRSAVGHLCAELTIASSRITAMAAQARIEQTEAARRRLRDEILRANALAVAIAHEVVENGTLETMEEPP